MSSLPPVDTSRHFLPTTPEFVTAATTPRHAVKIIYNITDKGNRGQMLAITNWGLAGVCSRKKKTEIFTRSKSHGSRARCYVIFVRKSCLY